MYNVSRLLFKKIPCIYLAAIANQTQCELRLYIKYILCLVKERPPLKESPPPTFGPTSCIASMSAQTGASFAWLNVTECTCGVREAQPQVLYMHI